MVSVCAINVLAELGTATWTTPQAIAYETAQEGVRQVIGFFAELLAEEEASAEPEPAAVTGWRAEQQAWAARGQALAPLDTLAIDTICRAADDLLGMTLEDDGDSDSAALANWFDLGEAENERIFRDRIVADQLAGTAQDRPVVLFVGGQPGDGKATITALATAALRRRGGPVVLSSAAYEPYHPRFHEPITDVPATAGVYVEADGLRWLARAEEWVIEQRCDAIFETDLNDPEGFARSARRFKAAGFQVEVAMLAMHEGLSRLGVLERHLRALESFGHGRRLEQARHDAGYAGVLRAAGLIDDGAWADRVAVLRPDGQLIYGNQRDAAGDWQQPARTIDAIGWERDRPWTVAESRYFLETVSRVGRIGVGAPAQWIRDESLQGAKAVAALARPRLHPDAVTLYVATAGTKG
ncbi:zeta toxin family protein [Kribbella sp. NPDC051952]|uniref:zeta toxin family protein n=1 Tax=Kribbella sp. NPDC051952 TaxID=3154851 RepID=UPI003441C121